MVSLLTPQAGMAARHSIESTAKTAERDCGFISASFLQSILDGLGAPWVVKIRGWNLEGHGALDRGENPVYRSAEALRHPKSSATSKSQMQRRIFQGVEDTLFPSGLGRGAFPQR
jgi:hypothetical protein